MSIGHDADSDDLDAIRACARAFREAILRTPRHHLPSSLQDFPRGSCGDATPLLGAYLSDRGFGSFQYILGQRGRHSHAWLGRGDLIVDITGDQFDDMPEAVYVGIDSRWHASFSGIARHEAHYRVFGTPARDQLRITLERILANLPLKA